MSKYESILKRSNEYYSLVCLSYIRQISKNKWRVYSRTGRNMGTFTSRKKAKERLRQIEYFKRVKKASDSSDSNIIDLSGIDELSYSCVVRELRKKCDDKIVMEFLHCFKMVFDILLLKSDSDIHNNSLRYTISLISTKYAIKLPKLKGAKKDNNDARSIVDNERILLDSRNVNSVANTFGPMGPYGYKHILNKEDPIYEAFFFSKNRDYIPSTPFPTVGLMENISNQTGFGVVDSGGGFLNM